MPPASQTSDGSNIGVDVGEAGGDWAGMLSNNAAAGESRTEMGAGQFRPLFR